MARHAILIIDSWISSEPVDVAVGDSGLGTNRVLGGCAGMTWAGFMVSSPFILTSRSKGRRDSAATGTRNTNTRNVGITVSVTNARGLTFDSETKRALHLVQDWAELYGVSRTGSVFSWLTNADSTYSGVPAISIAG
jgi:hypothetical protein